MGADTTYGVSLTVLVGLSFLGMFLLMSAIVWLGWQFSKPKKCPSPYTGNPLRIASDLSYSSRVKIYQYFASLHAYDNRMFRLYRAAVCRETGRLFPYAVNLFGKIKVDWNFLNKRYPGHYVSWGSLQKEEQEKIREAHGSLEGFQTQFSSPRPAPRQVEPPYAFAKPGPLYVNVETKVLLGWKCIPDSDLEVLIVQKPRKHKLF